MAMQTSHLFKKKIKSLEYYRRSALIFEKS